MATSALDMDAIFNGAGAVITTAANVTNAVADGINQVQGIMDNSRRNVQTNTYGGYSGYQQPVSYGYGYSDNSCYQPGYNGYYPSYNNPGNNSMYPVQPVNNGYFGFTDQGYGLSGNNNASPNPAGGNYPKGGAWGW